MHADPLILTARFDPIAAALFQRLRDRHFPPARNIVPAHCTLFHHLPGENATEIMAAVDEGCGSLAPCPFSGRGLRFLGRGVAVLLEMDAVSRLRERLAQRFADRLTPQDRQPFHPHVTIQNKAEPAAARALFAQLQMEGIVTGGQVVGLDLWHYRGGPWEPAAAFDLAGKG